MKLKEFLLHYTNVGDICYITDYGYNLAMCFIDDENLFIEGMKSEVLDRQILFVTQGNIKGIPVTRIELKWRFETNWKITKFEVKEKK